MKNKDSYTHVRGESLFVDDVNVQQGTLYALVFDSPVAHGKIIDIDYSHAQKLDGIVKIFTYQDIPGENQIGAIIQDEPLFAENEVHYAGQPLALIVAESLSLAKKAKKLINIEIEELPVVTTAKEAYEKQSYISPPRTFSLGDTKNAFDKCDYVFEGETFSNGQEHLYLETQGAYSYPMENGNIKIISSTQGPTAVQKITARVLGIPMHKIEVEVIRLGGAFGGKEDQGTPWAAMTALAASILQKPVKLILERIDDMRMTGKRHPYESQFKIGLDKNLKIIAYEAEYYQNAGAAADLSPAIAERTLFHATNSYFIPNVKATLYSCKTNLPPNTAFRGFGGPQGMFVIESAIAKAAEELNIPAYKIQEANLIKDGDEFPYGQIAAETQISNTWNQVQKKFDLKNKIEKIEKYNADHKYKKKGYALMPVTFGISFTNTMMNHARALVHVYQDGSVGISTGAVEMGQSVNTKMVQVAAISFGIDKEKVKIETTNTTRVANTSPTAASATADLNGKALLKACNSIKNRLEKVAKEVLSLSSEDRITFRENYIYINDEKSSLSWKKLIWETFARRISLSEIGHYSTPVINFDKSIEKGHPFAYYVYGTAFTVVKLDCIRGIYEIESVDIVHDFGKSINPGIDQGQVEGALVQGIGWMTMEEISYNSKGQLLSNTLSSYKVPDIFSAPKKVDILPLETQGNEMAILKSKAVGEPPLMYGIGTYFALENAIKAYNPEYKQRFNAPMTPEKVLLGLYEK
ncbi:MAG TPA: xanthine dehydrogenase [Bacteroidetes bacterium]|nr:xanthine dehydrogenase [Bacteroidota bacterium]